jgi:hypothetical protein
MGVLFAPEWRNWQTRQVEGLVTVKVVQVQVLSPAPYGARSYVKSGSLPHFAENDFLQFFCTRFGGIGLALLY